MAEGRGGSRWTEVIELADEIDTADHRASGDGMGNLKIQEACGRLREIARSVPVGEPDASQKTINGLLDAVERLNGQKDALRCENGQLRELLDLPIGERVAAVAELARGGPDDARLVNTIRGPLEAQGLPTDDEGWAKLVRWVVAAVRAAGVEESDGD